MYAVKMITVLWICILTVRKIIRFANESIQKAASRYGQPRRELKQSAQPIKLKDSAVATDENMKAIRHKFKALETCGFPIGSIVKQIEREQNIGQEGYYNFK